MRAHVLRVRPASLANVPPSPRSIIIGNFSSKTGTAFLTQPQREWIDLQKLIGRQKPSKRPKVRPRWPVRAWCFDRAVRKHGWWSRMMTVLFAVHIIALMCVPSRSRAARRSLTEIVSQDSDVQAPALCRPAAQ